MILSVRPLVADRAWTVWIREFPRRPLRDRYDLAATENRLEALLATLPDPNRLTAEEKILLKNWLEDYEFEFDQDQQQPLHVFRLAEAVNWAATAIGLVAAPFVPPLTVGALVMSIGLWSREIQSRVEAKQRSAIVSQIKRLLREIARKVR